MLVVKVYVKDCIETLNVRVPEYNLVDTEYVCGSTASNGYQMTFFEPIIICANLKDPHSNFWFFFK